MRIHREEEYDIAEINMTPFVDIVLVILVIFMATATFITQNKIPLILPSSSNHIDNNKENRPTIISITQDGKMYYDESRVNVAQLQEKIAYLSMQVGHEVVVRSDAKTPFEYVVTVIDTCKQYHITKFAIQTKIEAP